MLLRRAERNRCIGGKGEIMTMKKAKIAVLVSGGGTNLQALLDAQAAGLLPH